MSLSLIDFFFRNLKGLHQNKDLWGETCCKVDVWKINYSLETCCGVLPNCDAFSDTEKKKAWNAEISACGLFNIALFDHSTLCIVLHIYIPVHSGAKIPVIYLFWNSNLFLSVRYAVCSVGSFIIILSSLSNDCTRGGSTLAQNPNMPLRRTLQDWASVSQYTKYWATFCQKTWSLRNSAGVAMLWIYMLLLGDFICASLYVSVSVSVCHRDPCWWIRMFAIPLYPSDRSSIPKQFGRALKAWEDWEKAGPHNWQ